MSMLCLRQHLYITPYKKKKIIKAEMWVSDYKYAWYEKFAINVIRAGGVPAHVAFVMDGNRRYARTEHIKKIEGHKRGFDKLSDCLRWCLDIGIKEVTTFAFSIENFKRSEEEVDGLLDLAREKFSKLLEEAPKLHEHGVRVRIIGNISLLPPDVQQLIARAMLETEQNDKLFLNIAFSYTSRDEITSVVESILVHGNDLRPDNINERLLDECLLTRNSPPPDLLIRTSGESRISDFLMWQLTGTVLYFTNILWPQLTLWNLLAGIFTYQRAAVQMKPFRHRIERDRNDSAESGNFYTNHVQVFLKRLDTYRRGILLKLTSNS